MSVEATLIQLVMVIVRAALEAYARKDVGYLKRASADAAAWETEQRLIAAAKKRARNG